MILLLHAFLLFVAIGAIIIGLAIVRKRQQMFSVFYEKVKTKNNYSADASIIAPVRGFDEHTEENIMSMLQQDYKNKYEIIFVVDSDDKKTEKKIREIIAKNRMNRREQTDVEGHPYTSGTSYMPNAKIIHNVLFQGASGKSSALVAGVKHAKYPVIVSYDSDSRVRDTWLADLVAPLGKRVIDAKGVRSTVGASTGFRFYATSNSFKSYVLSTWNAIGFIGIQGKYPFTWGGGFAIKKNLIKKLGLVDIWKKVISDDSAVARKLYQVSMKSYFVPSCIALSYNSKFSHLTEFTTRQMTIIRWNWPSAYKTGIIMFGGSRLSIVLGILMFFIYAATGNIIFLIESILLLFIIMIELVIANIDFNNFSKILGIELGSRFKWSVAYLLGHWLMAYNIFAAFRKKTIVWRGKEYDFKKESKIL